MAAGFSPVVSCPLQRNGQVEKHWPFHFSMEGRGCGDREAGGGLVWQTESDRNLTLG